MTLQVCFCYIVLNSSWFNTLKAILIDCKHCQIEICGVFVYFVHVRLQFAQTLLEET